MENFNWQFFYNELAREIANLSGKEIYKLILEIEDNTGINSSLGKYREEINTFDHFSFFANFNRGIKFKNRIEILQYLKERFNLKSELPNSFDSIPVVNNMNAWFFQDFDYVNILIGLFKKVIKRENIEEYFNEALKIKGCALGKLTSGLYWIDADNFLPLDNNTFEYIQERLEENFIKDKIDYKKYIEIINKVKEKIGTNFVEISYFAKKEDKKKVKIQDTKQQFWLYAPGENAKYWDEFYEEGIMGIGWEELGDLTKYKTKGELENKYIEIFGKKATNNILANWEFLKEFKKGDIVIVKNGIREYIGYGIIEGDYKFDKPRENYKSIRKIKWIKKGIWEEKGNIIKQIVLKTLTNITKYSDYVEELKELLGIDNNLNILQNNSFKMQNLLEISKNLLERKKQIILYGPPGTGKTFNVKNIIENHSGEKYEDLQTDGKIEFITFHQSFSYEEFIEGIKAETDDNGNVNYEIKNGIFKDLVDGAKENLEKSKNNQNFNFEEIINDFVNYIEENPDFEIKKGTKIKVEKNSNGDFKTFKTYGNVDNQSLTKDILERDFQDFLNGKIQEPNNIKPSRESKSIRHGNALYYFALYKKIKDFLEKSGKNYFEEKQELKNYYLIIDEINRGNISKIFGELITLLEADKRIGEENELSTILPYSKEEFSIPSNIYIIATMNTSDKSIVSLDTALRRRFGFVEMFPDYEVLKDKKIEGINLANLLENINKKIEFLLDKDHLIGHSYFMKVENIEDLKQVFYNEIIPLLEEYFFGEEENIIKILGKDNEKENKKGFFKKKEIDQKLFEIQEDFEEKFEIKKDLNNKEFVDALKVLLNKSYNEKF